MILNRLVLVSSCLVSIGCAAKTSTRTGTTTFVVDGNRTYAELSFVRPDGSIHRALAFVDMGSPSMMVTEALFEDMHLDQNRSLQFRVGGLVVEVPRTELARERSTPHSVGSELEVLGVLPAGVLRRYQVVIDYRSRSLTLAVPGAVTPEGIPVPFHFDEETGLIAVDVAIDGRPYAVTIDNGSAYSWLERSTVQGWLRAHPEWERAVGAVGASNMRMADDGAEASGILARIPEIVVGPLTLHQVGVLGVEGKGPGNASLFDGYSSKNAVPVIGWIGGNVLRDFRVTIDYPAHIMYWLKQAEPDLHELDQVGLTLRSDHGDYVVAAIATRHGAPTVDGVSPGDKLIRIGDLDVRNAAWGAIYNAMHGKPDETRKLVLQRDGRSFTIDANVTAF